MIDSVNWICSACKERRHAKCAGKASCYCQHRVRQPTEPATGSPGE